jgi:hypothetical protein
MTTVRVQRAATLIVLLLTPLASAQEAPRQLSGSELRALPRRGAAAPLGSTEWTLRLPATARRGEMATLAPRAQRALPAPVAPERDPQLADDRIVVVAVDASGSAIDWRIVADPRVVRAEAPDATGALSGRTLTDPDAELRVAVAAGPDVRALHIYKPRWTGVAWVLDPIAVSRAR